MKLSTAKLSTAELSATYPPAGLTSAASLAHERRSRTGTFMIPGEGTCMILRVEEL